MVDYSRPPYDARAAASHQHAPIRCDVDRVPRTPQSTPQPEVLHMLAAIAAAAALAAATNSYAPQALVTNTSDASLVNGWGLSAGPTTPWWVADNGTDKSTLYNGTGA